MSPISLEDLGQDPLDVCSSRTLRSAVWPGKTSRIVHYLPDHIPGASLPAAIKHAGLEQPQTNMSDITKAAERFRAHPSYATGHTSIVISPIAKVKMMRREVEAKRRPEKQ